MRNKGNKNQPPSSLDMISDELTRTNSRLSELMSKGIYSGEVFDNLVDWQRYLTTLLAKFIVHTLKSLPMPTLKGFENCTSSELCSMLRKRYGSPQQS